MDDLKAFSSQMDSWIDSVLDNLNWTREGLFQTETNRECPINVEHVMDSTALERHLQYCPLITAGYTKEELDKEQSSKFFYERASDVCTIDLDDQTIQNILISTGGPIPESLPRTLERSITTLTVPQRLKIYEYCVEASRASNVQNKVTDEELFLLDFAQSKEDQPQSKLEMLAKMRDLKRRRQSYKGKNTHTGKKSHTEIIRDVISNQMELLSRMREEEKREKDAKEKLEKDKLEKEKLEKEKAERQSSRSGREGSKATHRDSSDEKHRSRHKHKSRERKSEEKEQSDAKPPSDGHHHKSKSSKKRRRSKERDSRSESESRHKHKKHKSKEKHRERSKDRTKEQEQDSKINAVTEMKDNKDKMDNAKHSDTVEGTDKQQARTNDI